MTTTAIEDELRDLLVKELGYAGPREALTSDFPLIDNEVLDSLGIFEMVRQIEARYGVEIDDEELIPSNFETLAAIAGLVDSKTPR